MSTCRLKQSHRFTGDFELSQYRLVVHGPDTADKFGAGTGTEDPRLPDPVDREPDRDRHPAELHPDQGSADIDPGRRPDLLHHHGILHPDIGGGGERAARVKLRNRVHELEAGLFRRRPGGREAAVRFIDSLKLASLVVHVADVRTLVLHPASSTHRQLTDEQLVAAGVNPGLIRFSVGLENVEDILDDIRQSMEQV